MPPPPDTAGAPRYTEIAPGPALAPWVECYWTIRATDAPSVPNRVLPDGCSDIIIGLGGKPDPVTVGTMQTAEVFPLSGAVDFFGVRFRPGWYATERRGVGFVQYDDAESA